MAETINPLLNPITAQDPDYLRSALMLQRRQQLAQTLQPMALSPIDYNPQGRVSPLQGLSKMAQAYMAAKLSTDNIDQQAKLQSRAAQAMAQAYGAGPAQSAASNDSTAAASGGPSPAAIANALAPAPEGRQLQQLPGQPQQALQLPGQQFGGSPTPLNPYGLPPMLVMMAAQGDPGAKAQVEALLKARELTGEQKNSRDPLIGRASIENMEVSGMTPLQKLMRAQSQVPQGSPQWDALQAAIQKEGALAVKQGELVMYGGKPLAYNPETDNGMVPQFGNVNGAMMPTGAQALPGYAQGSAGIAGAEQGAKTANSVFTGVQTPGGGTVSGYGGALFGPGAPGAHGAMPPQMPQQLPAGVGPGYAGGSAQAAAPGQREILMQELARAQAQGNQGDIAALQRELARLPGAGRGQAMPAPQGMPQGQPGVISGSGTSDAEINKNAGQVLAQLPQAVQQSMQVRRSLENALHSLQGTKTGPGTAGAFSLTAMLQNLGLPVAKEPTANYQTLTKYLNNSLSTASAIHGTNGSDARMEQFSHGQPNADTMNKGPLEQAIRYVLSQNDAVTAANQVIGSEYQRLQAVGDPRAAYNAQQAWVKQYDPKIFEFNRMGPAERKAMVDSMTAEQRKAFGEKYNAFNARGWVQ